MWVWEAGAGTSLNDRILRPASDPFKEVRGLKQLTGNLGRGVIKVSAVAPERHIIEAPVRVFHDQTAVKAAFKAGEFTADGTWRDFEIQLPDPLPKGSKILRLDVPAWRPSNTDPVAQDTRDLGIMVDSVEVLTPRPRS